VDNPILSIKIDIGVRKTPVPSGEEAGVVHGYP
jgi:hypothetical protein